MGSSNLAAARLLAARLLAARLLAARLWAARLLGAGCKQGRLQAAFPKVSFRPGSSQPIDKICLAPKYKSTNGVIELSGCNAVGCNLAARLQVARVLAARLQGCRLQAKAARLQGCKADGYVRVPSVKDLL